ncbi:MAG: DUF3248 domain-containing protein [Deinococcaceae bacterium]
MSGLDTTLDLLANNLVWRLGKDEDSEQLIIRVGFASSAPRFSEHSKLRSISDAEVQSAIAQDNYRIEWIDK